MNSPLHLENIEDAVQDIFTSPKSVQYQNKGEKKIKIIIRDIRDIRDIKMPSQSLYLQKEKSRRHSRALSAAI